jgi:MFS superfamily sulfate permease-like transporter
LLLRHWKDGLQLIPLVALGALAIAVVLVIRRPSRRSIRVASGLAVAVVITSAIGVFIHVRANYEAAPLDFRYTDSWPTTAEPVRWLLAATDTVGPSPSLAPTAMAFVALILLLAMVRHPALDGS